MRNYVCDICGKDIPRKYVCSFKIKEKYATPVLGVSTKRDICYECACSVRKAFISLMKEKRDADDGS